MFHFVCWENGRENRFINRGMAGQADNWIPMCFNLYAFTNAYNMFNQNESCLNNGYVIEYIWIRQNKSFLI